MTTPANKLQKKVLDTLIKNGVFAWRQNNMPVYDPKLHNGYGGYRTHQGLKGVPDIIAIINGRFVGIEIKAGRDRMSADQLLFKKRCERHGGLYFVVKRIEDLSPVLELTKP